MAGERCDLVLVCYDIADNKRRYRVVRELEAYGLRVQESVFECWLNPAQLRSLRRKLEKQIKQNEDRVAWYILRPQDRQDFRQLGCGPGLTQDVQFQIN